MAKTQIEKQPGSTPDEQLPDSGAEEKATAPEAKEAFAADSTLTARRVRVTMGYRGERTNEQYIEPGEYREDQAALFGLAEFLVESGRAEWMD